MRRKLVAIARYLPRIMTLVLLTLVAATIALANLSFEIEYDYENGAFYPIFFGYQSYGWPLIWRRYVLYNAVSIHTVGWYYSPLRLAANLAMWLVMLGAAAVACQWLMRRYPPRFRWSLRTMLAAVALAAALCAWYIVARDRANLQEPLIAEITSRHGRVIFERWGPRWLDLFGADPYQRRVIGVELRTQWGYSEEESAEEEPFLKRLAQLPDLQCFFLETGLDVPGTAAALGDMSRLRVLSIDQNGGGFEEEEEKRIVDECLTAIAKLPRLEDLYLSSMTIDSEQLSRLAGLTRLKSLSLEHNMNGDDPDSEPPLLSRLPALPRLEILDLSGSDTGDRDLPRLALLPSLNSLDLERTAVTDAGVAALAALSPRLKSLNIARTAITSAGLADLRSVKSLEELAIDAKMASPAGLKSLLALQRLKVLHIERNYDDSSKQAKLTLDHGGEIFVLEAELDVCRRALKMLQESRPGIVIDGEDAAFDTFTRQAPIWRRADTFVGRRAAWLRASGYPPLKPLNPVWAAWAAKYGPFSPY